MLKLIYLIMQQKQIWKVFHVYISSFTVKSNLASLNTEVDQLDIVKLVPVLADLSQLSNAVKIDVIKKAAYIKLIETVNNIDTSGFVLETKYDTDQIELENKIPDTSRLVKKTEYNTKVSGIENEVPSISGLAINSALTAVEDKIHNVSNLVKKTDYDKKFTEIEKKTYWSWSW